MASRIEFDEIPPPVIYVISYTRFYRSGGTYKCCDAYKTRKAFDNRVQFLKSDEGVTYLQAYTYSPVPMEIT
jgi:hypothetical protein